MKPTRQSGIARIGAVVLTLALMIGCGGKSTRDERADSPSPAPAGDPVGQADAARSDPPRVMRPEPRPAGPQARALAAALAALDERRYADAIDILTDALADHPGDVTLLEGLATAYRHAGHHDLALGACQEILASAPGNPKAIYNSAVALMRLERYDEAEAPLRQLLTIQPDHLEALTNLAVCLQAQGKLAQAHDAWQDLLAVENTAANHFDIGVILMDLGEPAAALTHFRKAAALDPTDHDAQMNLAAAARAAGSYGFAVVALRQATELRPDDAAGWAELGETLLVIYQSNQARHGPMLAEAVDAWRKSLAINPDQPTIQHRVGTFGPRLQPD